MDMHSVRDTPFHKCNLKFQLEMGWNLALNFE